MSSTCIGCDRRLRGPTWPPRRSLIRRALPQLRRPKASRSRAESEAHILALSIKLSCRFCALLRRQLERLTSVVRVQARLALFPTKWMAWAGVGGGEAFGGRRLWPGQEGKATQAQLDYNNNQSFRSTPQSICPH